MSERICVCAFCVLCVCTQEEFVMDVVGALEQDPELGTPQKHRQFLSSSVVFKEVGNDSIILVSGSS